MKTRAFPPHDSPRPTSRRERPGLSLSPSLAHVPLMGRTPPACAYAGGPFDVWRRRALARLKTLLAAPANPGGPLRHRTHWRRVTPLGTIEKVSFRAERGADVVAYWCLPANVRVPPATFVCLQGHSTGMHLSIGVDRSDERTVIEPPGDRDFALGCLRRGIAALCVEQRAFGTRGETAQAVVFKHNGCHDAAMRSMLLGRTLNGERVLDVDRAIDWLAWRGEVDVSRGVGVMGNSTGGTVSMYAAALLPRVRACIASCSFARFADSIASVYHCGCNCVPHLMRHLDMADVFGLAAPKPLVIVSGVHDELFPIASARRHFRQVKRIYAAADAPGRARFVEGPEGHRFYADAAWDAMLPMLDDAPRRRRNTR